VAYDGDVLALVLLTAAPLRVCPSCLAKRAALDAATARNEIGLLAETCRFGARVGLCCVCAEERVTLGVADPTDIAA
jgi:hypothetical protein